MDKRNADKKLELLIEVSRRAYEKGFTSGSGGNVSIRDGDIFYISSTGTCLGNLHKDSFTCMDLDGNILSGPKPSKEFTLHMECYKRRQEVQCIFHLHPIYTIAAGCREGIDPSCGLPVYTPGYALRVNAIPVIPYFRPGSQELAKETAKVLETCDSALLKNHGVIVVGQQPERVFGLIEEIEENAHIALLLGDSGNPMTESQIREIRDWGGANGK